MVSFLEFCNIYENNTEETKKAIIELCKQYGDTPVLWRGFMDKISTIGYREIRTNREPRNTSKAIHNSLDLAFQDHFGIKPRSSGLFVSRDFDVAEGYSDGITGIIVPTYDCKMVYSYKVEDLYTIIFEKQNISSLLRKFRNKIPSQKIALLEKLFIKSFNDAGVDIDNDYNNKSIYDIVIDNMFETPETFSYEGKTINLKPFVDMVIDLVVSLYEVHPVRDIKNAPKQNEITIVGKGYYYVDQDLFSSKKSLTYSEVAKELESTI